MKLPSSETRKQDALKLSIAVAGTLAVIKIAVALFVNSLALIATALDSFFDLISSSINFVSIRLADQPADKEHPFGHGKIEGLAGLFQSLVILISAGYLIFAAIGRLVKQKPLTEIPVGMGVMAFSLTATIFLVLYLRKTAKKTESLTIKADALHYATDIISNGGILLAFALIQLTGWTLLDPIVTIAVTLSIVWGAVKLLREALDELMDRSLPVSYREEVDRILKSFAPHVIGCHDYRSRRSGSRKLFELHVEIDPCKSFKDAHEVAESIRLAIENKILNAHVMVHYDPAGCNIERQATVEQRLR